MRKILKADAVAHFREHILPSIPKNDVPAKRQAWNDYVDALSKSGDVGSHARYWVQPNFVNKRG